MNMHFVCGGGGRGELGSLRFHGKDNSWDFPGGPVVKTLPSAGDSGSIPGQESKVAYATGCSACRGGDAGTLHPSRGSHKRSVRELEEIEEETYREEG